MYINIIITLFLLLSASFVIFKVMKLPKNIGLLFITQPIVMSSAPIIVFIGGILAAQMTDNQSLATLPITLMIIGVASGTIPAAIVAKFRGRKFAIFTGFSCALLASLLAFYATTSGSFVIFCLASLGFGFSNAFTQQLRFVALESVHQDKAPLVISLLMLSGIFAAFLGPELALAAKDLMPSPYGFSGVFLVLSVLILGAIGLIFQFKNPIIEQTENSLITRPLFTIIKQPVFIVSLLCAAIGYALMSYLMTATPMSMHHMQHHSLADTKWVIQSHIAAMFLPSLITAFLIKKVNIKGLVALGSSIYLVVLIIAFSGQAVMHYWWALILLGIGWNFLFLAGTTLLPLSYKANERHKVQAFNDFSLFGFQALASLMAGYILFTAGWYTIILTSAPFVVILFIITVYLYRNKKLKF